tara:strand:- start:347 stop:580 length:234 start_codon:yes stop_codon:yes gene_type:complete
LFVSHEEIATPSSVLAGTIDQLLLIAEGRPGGNARGFLGQEAGEPGSWGGRVGRGVIVRGLLPAPSEEGASWFSSGS